MIELGDGESVAAAVAALVVWVWPYVVDLVSAAETDSGVKRTANRVLSWIAGLGAAGVSFDPIDGDVRDAGVSLAVGLVAAIGSRFGIELSHRSTKDAPGRVRAQHTALAGTSVDELAAGDRLSRRQQDRVNTGRLADLEPDGDLERFRAAGREIGLSELDLQSMVDRAPS